MKKKKSSVKETFKAILFVMGIITIITCIFVGFVVGADFIDKSIYKNLLLIAIVIFVGIILIALEVYTLMRKKDIDGIGIYNFKDFLESNLNNLIVSVIGGVFSFIILIGWYNIIKDIKSVWLEFLELLNTFFPDIWTFIKTIGQAVLWIITNKWVWITILAIGGIILIKYVLYKIFIRR